MIEAVYFNVAGVAVCVCVCANFCVYIFICVKILATNSILITYATLS